MIETGLIIGTMSFLAVVILVEKLPNKIKPFFLGHHLESDIFLQLLLSWFFQSHELLHFYPLRRFVYYSQFTSLLDGQRIPGKGFILRIGKCK